MARTPAQRGRTGTWLLQARLARGYETQAVARREIERLAGWRIPQSQYAEWESGRRVPSEAAMERLQGFYGAQEETAASAMGDGGLAAALTRQAEAIEKQAEAISALTQEIRVAAISVLASQEGTGELLAQLVSAAREGTLDELLSGLRDGPAPAGRDR